MLLKQYLFLTCQETLVNLICGLYEIFYKPVCRKFLSFIYQVGGCMNNMINEGVNKMKASNYVFFPCHHRGRMFDI
jgi:hypothetical protein